MKRPRQRHFDIDHQFSIHVLYDNRFTPHDLYRDRYRNRGRNRKRSITIATTITTVQLLSFVIVK